VRLLCDNSERATLIALGTSCMDTIPVTCPAQLAGPFARSKKAPPMAAFFEKRHLSPKQRHALQLLASSQHVGREELLELGYGFSGCMLARARPARACSSGAGGDEQQAWLVLLLRAGGWLRSAGAAAHAAHISTRGLSC
jgi:hypothetical protein